MNGVICSVFIDVFDSHAGPLNSRNVAMSSAIRATAQLLLLLLEATQPMKLVFQFS